MLITKPVTGINVINVERIVMPMPKDTMKANQYRQIMSRIVKERCQNKEYKIKISMSQKGHEVSEETRKKIGFANSIILRGRKLSEETKKKMSLSRKGVPNLKLRGIKRQPFSEETKLKISLAKKGKYPTDETKKNMSLSHLGKKLSEEHKKKIRLFFKDKTYEEIYGNEAELQKLKRSEAHRKRWEGKTKASELRPYQGCGFEYKDWRTAVFKRDSYTCQRCGAKGYIEAHHIKRWAKYPNLRYDVNNGKTVCKNCHRIENKISKQLEKVVR